MWLSADTGTATDADKETTMSATSSWTARYRLRGVAVGLCIAAAGFAAGCYAAQPHMQNALAALQNARAELQVAEANKAGHRVNALRLVNEAIGEVQAGIAAGS
jgi:hypothetical protein